MVRMRIALIVAASLMALPATVHAAYPGENGRIAFASNREDTGIHTMNLDGSDVLRLTSDGEDDAAWSPDGGKIAFSGIRNGSAAVVVTNADGSGEITVTGPEWFSPTGDPSWSPDGQKIVFQGLAGPGDVELYVVNSDGSGGLSRLTDNSVFDGSPAWSPDGSEIAFHRFVPPCATAVCNFEIFVMDASGTNERRLTFDSDQDSHPNWSPDGQEIVWGNLNGNSEIQVMNGDGTGQSSFSPAAFGHNPAWSPDGRWIVWSGFGEAGNVNEINVMRDDGTDQHPITNSPSFDLRPDWQPIPNGPPDCSAVTASRPVFTTHNRRLVAISLDGATDPDGDPVTITVDGVTQDEPVTGSGDQTSPDAIDEGEGELRVRAERSPRGDGRVYRIAFTVTDDRGGSCSGTATVSVPRKKRKPAVDSAPPSYDSFGRQ